MFNKISQTETTPAIACASHVQVQFARKPRDQEHVERNLEALRATAA